MLPRTSARQLLANRRLAGLVVANGLSSIGDWLYLTMLPILVYRETGDAILVGLVGAGRLLPWLLLSIPAGALVDRFPGPRLLVVVEASRAALMFTMALLLATDAPLAVVLLASVAAVVAGTIAMPAHGRLTPLVAGSDEALQAANVVGATLDNVACVVGPALAGLLAVFGGIELAFVLNGASFLVVLTVMVYLSRALVPAPGTARPVVPDAAASGNGVLAIARAASARLTVDAAVSFASGALWVLPIFVATEALGGGDAAVGALNAVGGIGGIAGGLVAGHFMRRRFRGMGLGLGLVALGIALLPVGSSVLIALLSIGMATGALVTADTLNQTELQLSTPPERLGRALGILHTSAAAAAMAGAAAPGLFMAAFGIELACVLCASIVAVVGLAALAGPRMGSAVRGFWGYLPMFGRAVDPTIPA
jgi:hypothetical protein